MEPISTTATFATIVSLIADFIAHRQADEAKDADSFMAWLSEQRHDEIRRLLESNAKTVVSVKAMLSETRKEILGRLANLDKSFAAIASGVGPFRMIAGAVHPNSLLSEQAISVLVQFYNSGASSMLEIKMMNGIQLAFLDGGGGGAKYTEPRFIEDDLNALLKYELLALAHSGKGERVFKFTRRAAKMIEQNQLI